MIDVVLCILLIAGIIYAIQFNRKFQALELRHKAMEETVDEFYEAVEYAKRIIEMVKICNKDYLPKLENLVQQSKTIESDLAFLVERGEKISQTLENVQAKPTPSPINSLLKGRTPSLSSEDSEAESIAMRVLKKHETSSDPLEMDTDLSLFEKTQQRLQQLR